MQFVHLKLQGRNISYHEFIPFRTIITSKSQQLQHIALPLIANPCFSQSGFRDVSETG